jgi:hypothetical protein
VPVVPRAAIRKTVAFDARYTSRELNDRIAKLEGDSLIEEGLEVVVTAPGMIRVFPGRALVNGRFIEITAPQDIAVPALLQRPFALYLRSHHDASNGAVWIEFSHPSRLPRDGRGFLLLRQWPESPLSDDLMVAAPPDGMVGDPSGVRRRLLLVATGSPNQSIFSLRGLSFAPAIDTLLVWANGTKLRFGSGVTLDGIRTLTLTVPILTGERLEVLVLRGVRFREEQVVVGALITLSGANGYTPVLGDLLVFKNGILLAPGPDYAETSSTTITLAVAGAGETFEIYGVNGLLHRETHVVAADETVDLTSHAYRPGSHDLWVFGSGSKFATDFDYSQPNGEQIRLVEIYQASRTAIAPVPAPPDTTFVDVGAAFQSSRMQIGKAVMRVTAVTIPPLEINTIPQVLPVELPIALVLDETTLLLVDTVTMDPGDVTYDIRTPSFVGTIHTVLFRSFVPPIDATRDLGEYFDVGRGLADGLVDPDSNRPGTSVAGTFNPFLTIADINENAEVIAARGTFPRLGDRLTSLVDPSGILVAHGIRHIETGPDPIPNVTPTVAGLMGAFDKNRLDNHIGGGGAEHLVALPIAGPVNAGFLSGADQLKFDGIDPLVLPRGAWAMQFYGDNNPLVDPQFLTLQQKASNRFYYITRDGTIAEVDSVNATSFSLTVRFTMTIEVTVEVLVLFSLVFTLHSTAAVWLDGVKQAIGSVGNGRFEGSITIPATPVQHRVDVVFYGGGGGPVAGTRCSLHTNLLDPALQTRWISAPGLTS